VSGDGAVSLESTSTDFAPDPATESVAEFECERPAPIDSGDTLQSAGSMDVAADVAVGVAVNVKAFRYRIYPTDEQEAFFRQIAGCRRFVYNWALTERRAAWAAVKAAKKAANAPAQAGASAQASSARSLSYIDQQNRLPALKAGHPFLRDVPSHCLQAALRDLESAYKAFFKGLADKPAFASRDDRRSF